MNKYFKYVWCILSKSTDDAEAWVSWYFNEIICFWELSLQFISDCDFCFLSIFWMKLFKHFSTLLSLTAAYHSAADDQAECINQCVEIVLRCLIIEWHQNSWDDLLSEIEFSINTVINVFTDKSSFETLYNVTSWISFLLFDEQHESVNNFVNAYQQIWNDINDMLWLAQVRMFIYFDVNHISVELCERVYLRVVHKVKSEYKLSDSSILSLLHADSFNIIEQVSSLAYRLNLLSQWHLIHSVISVIHLKQTLENSYNRQLSSPPPDLVNKNELHVMKKIIDSHMNEKHNHVMHVHWKSTHSEDDMWESHAILWEDCCQLVRLYDRQQRDQRQIRQQRKQV